MKKFVLVTFFIFLIMIFVNFSYCEDELKLNSKHVIVVDNLTGRILYEKDATSKASIASLTKIMTSIMLVTNCKIDEEIEVPKSVVNVGGSLAGLKAGQKIKAYDLLYAMLLPSGNDAAYTVGYHIGNGDISNYANLMIKQAQKIGAFDTSFANPHGLDNQNHYSTAKDVAIITRSALKNKYINDAVKTSTKSVDLGEYNKTFNNTNALLRTYEFADGVKTGYTSEAGKCLVASATKDDRRYISVILGADTTNIRFSEAKKVLEYCFDKYNYVDISNYLKIYVRIPVIKGNIKYYESIENYEAKIPLKEGEYEKIYVKQEFVEYISAPLSKQTKIGSIKAYIDNEIIYEQDIYLKENIYKLGVGDYVNIAFRDIFNEYSKI